MIQFKKFRYSLGILMISAALCGFWQRANAQVVEIPDPNLERAIREELGLSSKVPVTQLEMLKLFRLNAKAVQIENLTGIEYAHNLEDLVIRDNPIKDLTPIASLRRLEHLNLSGIPIEDLIFLKDLTQLRDLHLFACNITDITSIQNLTKLVFLNLEANRITDISPLSNLTALEILRLGHNYIVDISPLANLTQLKELNLQDNQINNMEALANLTRLERLWIYANPLLDFSPIQGLSLTEFGHDEECELPAPPIRDRLQNRGLPSVFNGWSEKLLNRPTLSLGDQFSLHDLHWQGPPFFSLHFEQTADGYPIVGNLNHARAKREELLAKNPNIIFLAEVRQRGAHLPSQYPADFPYWLRDEDGNLVQNWHESTGEPQHDRYLLDFRQPGMQDIIVEQAIGVAKCGLYDGIFFDWWNENGGTLTNFDHPDGPKHYSTPEEERQARLNILQRIRANVPDDFLILCNNNRNKLPLSAPYINGGFMETFKSYPGGYLREDLLEIEDTLIWHTENLREPQIICLRGQSISTEPADSPRNKRWMRVFTTMSITLCDGYTLYTYPGGHFWYTFWDADLGRPIGESAQRYRGIEGLYIREFTNGWAVYNRSGSEQTITLLSSATPVSDRESTAASITHLLPDLDGEIYLKAKHPADVNGDWVVNILDLVEVSNSFGKSSPDPNGDGVVNVLDLVFVAQQFSQ